MTPVSSRAGWDVRRAGRGQRGDAWSLILSGLELNGGGIVGLWRDVIEELACKKLAGTDTLI